MAFQFKNSKGVTYYLHSKEVNLKGGRKQMIYFFARDIRPGALDSGPRRLHGPGDDEDRDAHPEEEVSPSIDRSTTGTPSPFAQGEPPYGKSPEVVPPFLLARFFDGPAASEYTLAMNAKALRVLVAGLCLALLVPACGRKAAESPAAQATKKFQIAVIPKGTTHEFWKSIHAGAAPGGRGARRRGHLEGAPEGRRPGPADHRRRGLHQPRRRRHRPGPARRPGPHAAGPGRGPGEDPRRRHRLRPAGERLHQLRRHRQLPGRRPRLRGGSAA